MDRTISDIYREGKLKFLKETAPYISIQLATLHGRVEAVCGPLSGAQKFILHCFTSTPVIQKGYFTLKTITSASRTW